MGTTRLHDFTAARLRHKLRSFKATKALVAITSRLTAERSSGISMHAIVWHL
jgi:hypothetical protein